MQVVLKPSEGFAPRTRKATAEALTALKDTLDAVQEATPGTFTIVEGVTPQKSASLVALLNEHYSKEWTFASRSTSDGTAIVQAKYDPQNLRPVRTVNRKPKVNGQVVKSKATAKR